MITKRLKSNSKLFTKDVSEFLSKMAEEEGSIHIALFSEKAVFEPFFDKIRESGRPVLIRTTEDFKSILEKIDLPSALHDTIGLDLSKRIHAIYVLEGKRYLFITSKEVIGAEIEEYSEGFDLVGSILSYARELH